MKRFRVAGVVAPMMAMAACVGGGRGLDDGSKYTINLVSPAEVAIGNDQSTSIVNRNTRPGEVRRIIAANPGLDEALKRNGVDVARVANIRIRPTNVVDVFTKA